MQDHAEDLELKKEDSDLFDREVQADTENDVGVAPGPVQSDTADPLAGRSFIGGKYKVLERLGTGGMGTVYKVHHQLLDRTLAVKVLNAGISADERVFRRFDQEAKASGTLQHENLIGLQDYGVTDDGIVYFVMDYLQGTSLADEIVRLGRIEEKRAISIFMAVSRGLAHAHSKGVIHRDLKPSNIMLVHDDNGHELAKIVDFGIAKRQTVDAKLTQTGEVFGTPLYMSPEQCLGKDVDARSDIYSLGCVMYETLSGVSPFTSENAIQTIFRHVSEDPVPLHKVCSGFTVSKGLEQLVAACLERDPEHRIQSAQGLTINLERVECGKSPLESKALSKALSKLERGTLSAKQVALLLAFFLVGCLLCVYVLFRQDQTMRHVTELDVMPERPDKYKGKTLAELNQAIERDPKSATAYSDRGYFHRNRDERDNAIDDFTKAIIFDREGLPSKALLARSELFRITEKENKALADASEAIRLSPLWSWPYVQRARVETSLEQYHRAIEDEDKALSLIGSDTPPGLLGAAFSDLSVNYDFLGNHQMALNAATRAIDNVNSGPADAGRADNLYWAYLSRSQVFTHMHRLDEAIADLEQTNQIHHKESQPWAYLAYAYAQKDDMTRALDCMKHAMRLEKFPARGHRFEGEMYRAAGKWIEAEGAYSTETSLEPWFALGFAERAMSEIALGEMRGTQSDLRRALQLRPESVEARSFLAVVEDQIGDEKLAQKYITAAFNSVPDLPINYVNRARIFLHHGQFEEALAECNKAISSDNFLPDAYATRAFVLDRLGDSKQSAVDRETAHKLGWHDFTVELKTAPKSQGLCERAWTIVRPSLGELKPDRGSKWPEPRLTDAQTWALACGAIALDFNVTKNRSAAYRRLEPLPGDPESVKWMKSYLLKSEFKIKDMASFFKALEFLSEHGEREEFNKIEKQISTMTPAQLDGYYSSLSKDPIALARAKVVQDNYKSLPSTGIASRDYIRYIGFCRMGYLAGYISEKESWSRIMSCASKIQSMYKSWNDLVDNYLVARAFGYAGKPSQPAEVEKSVRELLVDTKRPMQHLPFKLPLH